MYANTQKAVGPDDLELLEKAGHIALIATSMKRRATKRQTARRVIGRERLPCGGLGVRDPHGTLDDNQASTTTMAVRTGVGRRSKRRLK